MDYSFSCASCTVTLEPIGFRYLVSVDYVDGRHEADVCEEQHMAYQWYLTAVHKAIAREYLRQRAEHDRICRGASAVTA